MVKEGKELDFFDRDFIIDLVQKTFPGAKVRVVHPFVFAENRMGYKPYTLYVGFVVNAFGRTFTLQGKHFDFETGLLAPGGWLMFDAFSTNPNIVLFTGWRISIQYGITSVDELPPVVDKTYSLFNCYYNETNIYEWGMVTSCDRVSTDTGSVINDFFPVDGLISNINKSTAANLIWRGYINNVLQFTMQPNKGVLKRQCLNYWSDANSFSYKIIWTLSPVARVTLIVDSVTVYELLKPSPGLVYTVRLSDFTNGNFNVYINDNAGRALNNFIAYVSVGVDLVPTFAVTVPARLTEETEISLE